MANAAGGEDGQITDEVLLELMANVRALESTVEPRLAALSNITCILSEHIPDISHDAVADFVLSMSKDALTKSHASPSARQHQRRRGVSERHPPPVGGATTAPSLHEGSLGMRGGRNEVSARLERLRAQLTGATSASPTVGGSTPATTPREFEPVAAARVFSREHRAPHEELLQAHRLHHRPPIAGGAFPFPFSSLHGGEAVHAPGAAPPWLHQPPSAPRHSARFSMRQQTGEDALQWMTPEELAFYHEATDPEQKLTLQHMHEEVQNTQSPLPLRFRVLTSNLPLATKAEIMKKLESMHSPFESAKYTGWLDTLLRVPFGEVKPLPVNADSPTGEIADYVGQCKATLDRSVLGHGHLKEVLMCVIASWIRTGGAATSVNALGIQGPVGIGKTTIIRSGLSSAVHRPFAFISCGGSSGGSLLSGHSFTYEGSVPGAVVDAVTTAGCMNPIILLDEVDKISADARGDEIFNTLLHMLDPSQNTEFQDRYLNVPIDISKAFFVLTYNDADRIPSVLRDRLLEVRLSDFNLEDKVAIASEYLLPDILTGLGLPSDWVRVEMGAMRWIVEASGGTGMRATRHALISMVSTLNMISIGGRQIGDLLCDDGAFGALAEELARDAKPPYVVTRDMAEGFMARTKRQQGADAVASTAMYC